MTPVRDAALALIAALDAGDLDAPAALGLPGALLRAIAAARAGLLARARGLALAVLPDISNDPAAALAAAAVLHATRDYQRSLEVLADLCRRAPAATRTAARRAIGYASALGWEREVAAAIERGRSAEPLDPVWDVFEAQMHLRVGDLDAALPAARRGLQRAPGSAKLRMELAGILAQRGEDDTCAAEVAAALRLAPPGDAALFERAAMATLLRAGDLGGAFARGEAALRRAPDDAAVAIALADMSLWQGDDADALRRAERASGRTGAAGHLRIRGQLALRSGSIDQALADLSASIAAEDSAAAEVSLAEALVRRGAWDPAHAALTRATEIAGGYLAAAWIVRFLAAAGERPEPDAPVNPRQIEEFAEALAELAPEGAAALVEARQGPLVAAARTALARMGCNRSVDATYHDGHVLIRMSTRTGVRHASRRALQAIRGGDPGRALALFDAVLARWPRSSLPLAHRGELRMWLGDDEGARADLEAALAINPRTRWAYVGLTLLATRADDPATALATSERGIAAMRGTVGPAVYAHRAEARRRLGDLAGALADLAEAVASHPARIGAWLDLGLAFGSCGDAAGLARAFDELRARAPGLVSDAAAAASVCAWSDRSEGPGPEGQLAALAQAHAMLRGNRSSTCVTYFGPGGQLRAVPHGLGAAAVHARDELDLAGVHALLLRRLGVTASPSSRSR